MVGKKAQAWSLDALIAILIFFSGVTLLFFYAVNFNDEVNSSLNDLFNQGNTAANLILSNEEAGILTNNLINQTLLDEFFNANYQDKKSELGVRDNFYFKMDNLEAGGFSRDYIGNMNSSEVENSIKIERIASYNNKPTKFELFIWS